MNHGNCSLGGAITSVDNNYKAHGLTLFLSDDSMLS